jgi:hypothetical protein
VLPFLTTYDPLGGSSGSIDPLGALQSYGALADLLLPGVTTITTRSRYLSMLCAALANAEKSQRQSFLPGASGLAQRRKAVEPFERLWALACVAARDDGVESAADGLRGISYAEKMYREFKDKGNPVSADYKLLKYQSRTGAVGTYWTALASSQLIHRESGSLSPDGRSLAECFPKPKLKQKDLECISDPERSHRVRIPLDDLLEWAHTAHLRGAENEERMQLGEALTADGRRECVRYALVKMADDGGIPEEWDAAGVRRLNTILASTPHASELHLTVVVEAILVTESFHEALLCVFETLLWWGTERSAQSLQDLLQEKPFRRAIERCRECSESLRLFRESCDLATIRNAIQGLATFSLILSRLTDPREITEEILRRHHQVQAGKIDGGAPKRDWISWENERLLRPSPRFQRTERPSEAVGSSLTHPYRLEQFVHMLRENDLLASA